MELFQAQDNFIILNGPNSLWCNRQDGRLQPRFGVDLGEAWSLKCRGIVYGIIGKIQFFPGADWRLLVISKRTLLGSLPGGHEVFRIDRIAVLTLSSNESPELELDLCEQHQRGGGLGGVDNQQRGLGQTWSKIKTAASTLKEKNVKDRDLKDKEKLERRFVEELMKMFNDSDSFFYSPTGDLTNTLQRQFSGKYNVEDPLWKRCDKRFFWNEFMVKELLNSEDPIAHKWVMPIIQGYCKIAHCVNTFQDDDVEEGEERGDPPFSPEEFDLVLISRRSLNRAGTRYRRRGVDENGDVANYVETEQIICTSTHNVSFVQVRGSVPVYWSQPGYKYRPPPRLDRDENETQLAFRKHFDHQLELYKTVAVISLVDQSGREKIISDVFMDNILAYNSPFLTYVTFDFHEYCRGMRFENVSVLVESIPDVIKDVRYCWTDAKGIICDQRGVFRVNCMDCLDRTNVVQAALARHIIEQQLKKLGKQLPDQILPASIRTSFQEMWASNGDAISRQYAGTAAMKGDFTRTGERKFTGVMKDGYNSANRYYLNRFKAAYRQTLIDVMLGNPVTEDIAALIAAMKNGPEEEHWTMEREECVAQLVEHCKQLLLTDEEEYISGWALVDPFYSMDNEVTQDQDVILLLTYHAYYVASYDDEAERITQYERIALEDLEKVEIGFETGFKTKYLFIRLYRRHQGNSGYFHTLRTIQHRTAEDARSVLLCIADTFASARATLDLGLKVAECRLDRRKSKPPPSVIQISSKSRLSSWSKPTFLSKSKSAADRTVDDLSFASMHRTKVGALHSSFSDSCLAKTRLEDSNGLKISSNSAPQSCSGSSGSEVDDDSGGTDEMELYDPSIDNFAQGNDGEKVENGAPENEGDILFEGNSKSDELQNENIKFGLKQKELQTTGVSDEGETSKECGFVVGDDAEEREANVEAQGVVSEKTPSSDSDSNKLEPTSEGYLQSKTAEKNEVNENENEGNQSEQVEIRSDRITPGDSQEKDSKQQGDSSELNAKENEIDLLPKQENGETKSKELSVSFKDNSVNFKDNSQDHEISFHGTTATMRVSHSSVELGTMAYLERENNGDKSPERRRFGARFSGNRGLKLFATAQARGRTLIPELRSKLSSFSQQVRSRSPRMSPKRPSLHSEPNSEQKQLKRKCRTKIIEL